MIAGAVAALAPKRRGRHAPAGTVFVIGVAVIGVTVAVMATIRWQHNRRLLAIAGVTATLATNST